MKDIEKRMNDMKLSEAEQTEMEAKYEEKMKKPMGEFVGHMMRIGLNPQLAPHLEGVLEDGPSQGSMPPAGGME